MTLTDTIIILFKDETFLIANKTPIIIILYIEVTETERTWVGRVTTFSTSHQSWYILILKSLQLKGCMRTQ